MPDDVSIQSCVDKSAVRRGGPCGRPVSGRYKTCPYEGRTVGAQFIAPVGVMNHAPTRDVLSHPVNEEPFPHKTE